MENVKGDFENNFDAFILGTLPEKERAAFEARLKEDPAFKEKFIEHERAVAGIRLDAREELREELNRIHDKKDRKSPSGNVIKFKSFLPWAAAAAILLLIGFWFLQPTSTPPNLVAQYYQPYTLKVGLRNNGGQEALLQIDDLYAKGEYAQVIPLLTDYLKDHPTENTLRLALAISLFEDRKVKSAMQELSRIEASNDPFLVDQVSWYKALMLIDSNKPRQAKSLLNKLAKNPEADHHEKAAELYSMLK